MLAIVEVLPQLMLLAVARVLKHLGGLSLPCFPPLASVGPDPQLDLLVELTPRSCAHANPGFRMGRVP
jgi:hypothetical protein